MTADSASLSRRGVGYAIAAAAVAAVIAVFVASRAGGTDPAPETPATPAAPTAAPDADAAVEWLPHDPEHLVQAGRVAEDFTELYTGFTTQVTTEEYYEELHKYTTADYADRLAPTAGTESAREELAAEGTTISSVAQVAHIRDLLSGQITFIVNCTTVTSSGSDQTNEDYQFAVTVLPGPGDTWQVHDLQLAEDGQHGDMPG